jgi:hypothetical protein
MQGKKSHQEKLFIQFQLSDYVPADNFYRQQEGTTPFSVALFLKAAFNPSLDKTMVSMSMRYIQLHKYNSE